MTTEVRKKRKNNKSAAIRDYLAANPQAGPTEVVKALAEQKVKVTSTHVSRCQEPFGGWTCRRNSQRRTPSQECNRGHRRNGHSGDDRVAGRSQEDGRSLRVDEENARAAASALWPDCSNGARSTWSKVMQAVVRDVINAAVRAATMFDMFTTSPRSQHRCGERSPGDVESFEMPRTQAPIHTSRPGSCRF